MKICPKCGEIDKLRGPYYKKEFNKLKYLCRCGYNIYVPANDESKISQASFLKTTIENAKSLHITNSVNRKEDTEFSRGFDRGILQGYESALKIIELSERMFKN